MVPAIGVWKGTLESANIFRDDMKVDLQQIHMISDIYGKYR